MNYESMTLTEVIDYVNMELSKGRTMKDIEECDFGVSKGVITKRLNRKNYRKIDNTFIFDENIKNTTKKTTKIIQKKIQKYYNLNQAMTSLKRYFQLMSLIN